MERRGSGLRKIISETEKLPSYTEELRPEFHSTATDFRVMLKNVNYNMYGSDHDTTHDNMHDATHDKKAMSLIDFCTEERARDEMMAFLGLKSREHFRKNYLKPLLDSGKIKMTIPYKPKSQNKKYVRADK